MPFSTWKLRLFDQTSTVMGKVNHFSAAKEEERRPKPASKNVKKLGQDCQDISTAGISQAAGGHIELETCQRAARLDYWTTGEFGKRNK